MSKFKLKFTDGIVPSERHILKTFTNATSLKVVDLYCLNDCAFVTINENENVQVLKNINVKAKLNEAKIRVILPNNHNSSLTVFANKIRPYLLECSTQEIITEINESNNVQCDKAFIISRNNYKDGQTKSLKLIFNSEIDARKIMHEGFTLFDSFIPSTNICIEDPINFIQCYRCYQFGHELSKCNSQQLCSICASNTHAYVNCPNPSQRKCILCKGNHCSIDRTCPVRRKTIQTLLATKKEELNKKFAPKTNPVNHDNSHPSNVPAPANDSVPTTHNNNNWTKDLFNFPPIQTKVPHRPSKKEYKEIETQTNPPTVENSIESTSWETKLLIANEFAKLKAKGDEMTYIRTMNKFLKSQNKEELHILTEDEQEETAIEETITEDVQNESVIEQEVPDETQE